MIIGPRTGNALTTRSRGYRVMLPDYELLEMTENGMPDLWFQQDGAPDIGCRGTIALLGYCSREKTLKC